MIDRQVEGSLPLRFNTNGAFASCYCSKLWFALIGKQTSEKMCLQLGDVRNGRLMELGGQLIDLFDLTLKMMDLGLD